MSSVEEIEAAIDGLPLDECKRIAEWFRVREQMRWDKQMDHDSSTGKLDFLFGEVEDESAEGSFASGLSASEIGRDSPVLEALLYLLSEPDIVGIAWATLPDCKKRWLF